MVYVNSTANQRLKEMEENVFVRVLSESYSV